MRIGLDTNVLLRIAEPTHRLHRTAEDAIAKLGAAGHDFVTVAQVHYEFWAVATKTRKANGLELPINRAERALDDIEAETTILPDDLLVYRRWRALIAKYRTTGVNSHDLRIVAALSRHGVDTLLTFNAADFRRYAEVEIVEPAGVAAWLAGRP